MYKYISWSTKSSVLLSVVVDQAIPHLILFVYQKSHDSVHGCWSTHQVVLNTFLNKKLKCLSTVFSSHKSNFCFSTCIGQRIQCLITLFDQRKTCLHTMFDQTIHKYVCWSTNQIFKEHVFDQTTSV